VSLDERADCIVELTLPEPIAGDRLIPLIAPIRRFGAKPVAFEGAAAEEEPTHLPGWTPLLPGVRFDRVRAGLLLANRHGPVNAMEFADFAGAVQTLADQLGAGLSSVQMASVLERARDLDSLCMQLDAQVGLNVEGPEPLSVGDLERLAVEQQLVERGNNRFARFNARDGLLFTLSLADEPGRLTLLLDVPRARPPIDPGISWSRARTCWPTGSMGRSSTMRVASWPMPRSSGSGPSWSNATTRWPGRDFPPVRPSRCACSTSHGHPGPAHPRRGGGPRTTAARKSWRSTATSTTCSTRRP
jgi:hypothetical protein